MLTSVLATVSLWFLSGIPADVITPESAALRVVENIYYVQLNGMT